MIKKLTDDLDWTTDLGDAFVDQPKDVADALQRVRTKADTTGSLRTLSLFCLTTFCCWFGTDVIIIESTSPEAIYVPTYIRCKYTSRWPASLQRANWRSAQPVATGSAWNNNHWNWGSGDVYPPRLAGYPRYGGGNNIKLATTST